MQSPSVLTFRFLVPPYQFVAIIVQEKKGRRSSTGQGAPVGSPPKLGSWTRRNSSASDTHGSSQRVGAGSDIQGAGSGRERFADTALSKPGVTDKTRRAAPAPTPATRRRDMSVNAAASCDHHVRPAHRRRRRGRLALGQGGLRAGGRHSCPLLPVLQARPTVHPRRRGLPLTIRSATSACRPVGLCQPAGQALPQGRHRRGDWISFTDPRVHWTHRIGYIPSTLTVRRWRSTVMRETCY